MNAVVIIVQLLVLAALFTAVLVPLVDKDPESMVDDYPPDIQAAYYKTHPKSEEQITRSAMVRKGVFLVAAAFVLAWMASLAGAATFTQAALVSFLYIAWIGAYDTFILDWIFFPRIKKWRLPGTEHMDKAYRQKWFHLKGVLQVLPLGIIFALLCGGLATWLF